MRAAPYGAPPAGSPGQPAAEKWDSDSDSDESEDEEDDSDTEDYDD